MMFFSLCLFFNGLVSGTIFTGEPGKGWHLRPLHGATGATCVYDPRSPWLRRSCIIAGFKECLFNDFVFRFSFKQTHREIIKYIYTWSICIIIYRYVGREREMCVCVYIHTNIHILTHTHIYIYIYIIHRWGSKTSNLFLGPSVELESGCHGRDAVLWQSQHGCGKWPM